MLGWETEVVRVARWSTCAKSRRGVAIFRGAHQLSAGYNGPPQGFKCDGSEACRAGCGRVAVHAEERALLGTVLGNGIFALRAMHRDITLGSADLIHAKVDAAGDLVGSGGPSCPGCSRLIVEAGIARVWLFHGPMGVLSIGLNGPLEPGWQCYEATEFHRLTLLHCGLHTGKRA